MESDKRDKLGRGIIKTLMKTKSKLHNFDSISTAALIQFTDSVEQFIQSVAKLSSELSELSGRTLVSFHDVLIAFSILQLPVDGIVELKNLMSHSLSSQNIDEISRHLMDYIEGASGYSGTSSIVELKAELNGSSVNQEYEEFMAEDKPENFKTFIPSHMPSFPNRHSYKRTPVNFYLALFYSIRFISIEK
jgi:histone H3/H4